MSERTRTKHHHLRQRRATRRSCGEWINVYESKALQRDIHLPSSRVATTCYGYAYSAESSLSVSQMCARIVVQRPRINYRLQTKECGIHGSALQVGARIRGRGKLKRGVETTGPSRARDLQLPSRS